MATDIACIGGAHIDRIGRALGAVVMGSSNPVELASSAGGVARNVAENLARLGVKTGLVSRVGADTDGEFVLDEVASLGVNLRLCTRARRYPTASFTALNAPDGQMVIAMADMAIYDDIDAWPMATLLSDLQRIPNWFLECNLPEEILGRLLAKKPTHIQVFVDAVSVAKAVKLRPHLEGINCLFANEMEAAAIVGLDINAPLNVIEAGDRLLDKGVEMAVITRAGKGAYIVNDHQSEFLPIFEGEVLDTTGGGDALVAGVIEGMLKEESDIRTIAALSQGLAAASLAMETYSAVNPDLTLPAIKARQA